MKDNQLKFDFTQAELKAELKAEDDFSVCIARDYGDDYVECGCEECDPYARCFVCGERLEIRASTVPEDHECRCDKCQFSKNEEQ